MQRRRVAKKRSAARLHVNGSTDGVVDETDDLLSPDENVNDSRYRNLPALSSYTSAHDPAVVWFFDPITLSIFSVLCVSLAVLAYSTEWLQLPSRVQSHLGVITAIASFLIFCMLYGRDGPLRRPHPSFWRAVLGLNVLYWCALCFLFFQDKEYARRIVIPYIDSGLGKPIQFRAFDENCDLTWPNFRGQAFEIFSLAHAIGWFGKALILRDWFLLNTLSIVYELVEISLMNHIPEFRECWWDHVLLDVLGCNALGSFLGMKLCKHLAVSHFSWRGLRLRQGSYRERGAKVIEQLTPFDFADFQWQGLRKFRNYISTLLLLATFLTSEVDIFYLKQLLWIPSTHPLVTIRLVLVFLWALPAARELYEYVNHSRKVKRMGLHVWLLLATTLLEFLIVIKFSKGEFNQEIPRRVKIIWLCVGLALCVYPIFRFGVPAYNRQKHQPRSR